MSITKRRQESERWNRVKKNMNHGNREGTFLTLSRVSGHRTRRAYLSADARDWLGDPEFVAFYIDPDGDRIAVERCDSPDSAAAYKVNATSAHVSIEKPLQAAGSDRDSDRIELVENGDWLIGNVG